MEGVMTRGRGGRLIAAAVVVSALAGCAMVSERVPSHQTARSLPAEVLNRDVTQATIHQTICVPGYTASVRPSTSLTNGIKLKLLRERGLPPPAAPDYELDHLVPLALGGHPRALGNLQLQAWEGERGARAKDVVERRFQERVCTGKMDLDEARRLMFYDEWAVPRHSESGRTR